ncbi:MAG TPA: GTPase HflX [Chitinophagaceae bacterium]|nr:GTPase HflX [Chitinophagaceae bacterium]
MIEKKKISNKKETAVLVGLITGNETEEQVNEYLDELAFLAMTAGVEAKRRFVQKMDHPHVRTFVGKGKLHEIRDYIEEHQISTVLFDDELSATQISNIEKVVKIKTLDRSDLILDIFARRAKTAQAKAQVELAQYQHIMPRLKGMWTHLERQKGGIGLRGPGETEIETDRRIVNKKITLLRKKLSTIDKQAATRRKNRGEFIRVALVGYTNVGKSTIMRRLSKSDVFAENKLFATLDTTTRKIVLEGTPFLMSDTVGFIRKLPHQLVESFKSTLDEVLESDILLHVVDLSHPAHEEQIAVVNQTLRELGAEDKPVIMVFNKLDAYKERAFDDLLEDSVKEDLLNKLFIKWEEKTDDNAVFISANTKENLKIFRDTLLAEVRRLYKIRYPYKTIYYY